MNDHVNINVVKFFDRFWSDPELRERYRLAEEAYPGSLEIRAAVLEETLLPIAEEMGLGFTLKDLAIYENMHKNAKNDKEVKEGDPDDDTHYFLIDHGWENNEARMCGDND